MEDKMKNFLVTGGAGFIGSIFIKMSLPSILTIIIINVDALTYAVIWESNDVADIRITCL
jgi:dTDP-D-glucose 4,6-dehydratase